MTTPDYDALVAMRAAQNAAGCCDCAAKNSGYTSVRQGIICRGCYGKRCHDPRNPHFGDTRSG